MIRPRAGPSNVSTLRHHRNCHSFAIILAVIGVAACSENPVGPSGPETVSPALQLSAPTSVARATLAEVDAVKAEVEGMRVTVNGYNAAMGYPMNAIPYLGHLYPATPTPSDPYVPPDPPPGGCIGGECPAAYSISFGAPPSSRLVRGIPWERTFGRSLLASPLKPHFLYVGDGPTDCDFYRTEMRRLGADYYREYHDFVTNFVPPWDIPLNFLIGGPLDKMRSLSRQMYFVKVAYDGTCRGGSGGGGGGGGGTGF